MVTIVIDESAIQAIAILLAPAIGWIITEMKRRLAQHQGNAAYAEMKERANLILNLAEKFPETKKLAADYRTTAVHAQLLWQDPKNNSEELAATMNKGKDLLNEIFRLIEKYSPLVEKIIDNCQQPKK